MSVLTIDFETETITSGLPPKPVGVAVVYPSGDSMYWAWGHKHHSNPTIAMGNNCTEREAVHRLQQLYKEYKTILFHNGSFDLAVGTYHLGLPYPEDYQDTLHQLYLYDPHAKTLALKPSAEKYLGLPPEERDTLHEWIMANIPKATKKKAGGFICYAPVSLVGPYAIADAQMTRKLYEHFKDKIPTKAYNRELKLTPILVENTLQGIHLDVAQLEHDYNFYSLAREETDKIICKKLGRTINVNSSEELANAIIAANIPANWVLTAKDRISTSKENLVTAIQDVELLELLNYRGTLSTYLDTFYTSWLEKEINGILHFNWNQVRNEDFTGKAMGTRTGRLSSTPSLLNVPKEVKKNSEIIKQFELPPLPNMRKYLLSDPDTFWLKRDYSAQELRILAHFEDGTMMHRYNENPMWDLHAEMSEILSQVLHITVTRLQAKTVAFSILYGSGLDALAEGLGCDRSQAGLIKNTYLNKLPGVKNVMDSIKYSWDRGDCIKTWGGRSYYKEQSRYITDKRTGRERWADFGYKGLNYLIQGSAADVSKQAIINYNQIKKDGRFLLMVHDELNISGPISEMKILKEAMSDIQIDVPMLSEGKYGKCFGKLIDCE